MTAGPSAAVSVRSVRIVGFPLAMHRRATEQYAELMREFALLTLDRRPPVSGHDVPQRLLDLIAELTAQFGGVGALADQTRDRAAARGDVTVDLDYEVPLEVGPAVRHLRDLLDEADDFCRSGESLLTLAATPDVAAFRSWYLDEFTRQIAGEPPRPWTGAVR
jgi:hypothetical protein